MLPWPLMRCGMSEVNPRVTLEKLCQTGSSLKGFGRGVGDFGMEIICWALEDIFPASRV